MSDMIRKEAQIVIESVGRRGDGTGHWQGRPVFVPRALPGETVRVKLRETRDKGLAAQLIEITDPAPDRTAPPCPYYDDCGGCTLQHWAAGSYQSWQTARVAQLLDRAGLAPAAWLPPVFIPQATRRRATLTAFVQNKTLRLGYRRARSHDIIDIPDCMVLSPALNQLAQDIRPFLTRLLTDSRPATVFLQQSGLSCEVLITGALGPRRQPGLAERELMAEMVQACKITRLCWRAAPRDEPEVMLQQGVFTKTAGSLSVALPPGAFLQPSAEGEAALVKAVTAGVTAHHSGRGAIADLFAGCGTFTGPLLEKGPVYAAEGDPAALEALTRAGTGQSALQTERRNLFTEPLSAAELARFETVVMDPPRAGAKAQAEALAAAPAVQTVISVSCNPSTFVRDGALLAAGGYQLQSMQVIDQFIWSPHIELAGVFTRSK